MAPDKSQGFSVYKGLQRPLIFKSLKGKFIYWGMGCVLCAFLVAIILATTIHPIAGVIGLIAIGLGGLLLINQRQKKGLHNKTKSTGTYIIAPLFKRSS